MAKKSLRNLMVVGLVLAFIFSNVTIASAATSQWTINSLYPKYNNPQIYTDLSSSVQRSQFGKFLYKLVGIGESMDYTPCVSIFSDANTWTQEEKQIYGFLSYYKIFSGSNDGKLHMENYLTRAEAATVISNLVKSGLVRFDTIKSSSFTDISNHWAKNNILEIANYGLMSGTVNNMFEPDSTISIEQVWQIADNMVGKSPYVTSRQTVANAFSYVWGGTFNLSSTSNNTVNMNLWTTRTISADLFTSNSTYRAVRWESANTNIVSITNTTDGTTLTSTAEIRANNVGTTTVTASALDGTGKSVVFTVTVNYNNTSVSTTGVKLPKSEVVLGLSEAVTLTANVSPSDATNQSLTWSSSDTNVATVTALGTIRAVGYGTATIRVRTADGTYSDTCYVRVLYNRNKVTGVTLSDEYLNMDLNSYKYLTETVSPSYADYKDVSWSSSDEAVATVSTSGRVKAVGYGSAIITVNTNDGAYTDSCVIYVGNAGSNVTGISLSDTNLNIELNSTKYLTATVLPTTAPNYGVTWKTTDTNVVTVSSNGLVTAVGFGSAYVTATSYDGKYSASCYILVNTFPAERVTGITLATNYLSMQKYNSQYVAATVLPSNAKNKNVKWSSNNTYVATVTATGVITAIADGEAWIYAYTEDGNYSASVHVVVGSGNNSSQIKTTGVTLNTNSLSLNLYDTQYLTATVLPTNATNKNVSWSSSDYNVASVASDGLVRGVGTGGAWITVTTSDGSYTASAYVNVGSNQIRVTGVTLNTNYISLRQSDTQYLTATVAPTNATNKNVSWSSSNYNVASVTSNGLVQAIGAGEAWITVTTNDGSYTATAYVSVTGNGNTQNQYPTSVTGITLPVSSLNMHLNETYTMYPTVAPTNATNQRVTYLSSDTKIIKVTASGVISAVGYGQATVFVTTEDGKFMQSCNITVGN